MKFQSATSLFAVDTPLQKVSTPFMEEKGIELTVKRDDLIHPFVSGNKWRKLKYNVADYYRRQGSKMATFGGAYSNHLIATACAGAMLQIPTHGIVRGDELTPRSNHVLKLCQEYGMTFTFVDRDAYRDKSTLTKQFEKQGYYVVPEGGDNELGIQGCIEILNDEHPADVILVPLGTGTTFRGIAQSQPKSLTIGISAVKGIDYLNAQFKADIQHSNWQVTDAYAFGGFGKFDAKLLDFTQSFTTQTGILLDPVYTGKMMYALYDLIKREEIPRGAQVTCIHTGGMTGILSDKWLET